MSAEMIRRSEGRLHPHAAVARTFVGAQTRHSVQFKRRSKAPR